MPVHRKMHCSIDANNGGIGNALWYQIRAQDETVLEYSMRFTFCNMRIAQPPLNFWMYMKILNPQNPMSASNGMPSVITLQHSCIPIV